MPYIGASNSSHNGFQNLKEKHSIGGKGVSTTSLISSDGEHPTTSATPTTSTTPTTTTTTHRFNKHYIGDDTGTTNENEHYYTLNRTSIPKSRAASVASMGSLTDFNLEELLRFPNESTHAYSYNPLSPNSLAVRLTILKRSLEIMIRNPSLLKEPQPNVDLKVQTPNGSRANFYFGHHDTTNQEPLSQKQTSKFSLDGLTAPPKTQHLRNASSAALSAFFNNGNTLNGIQPSDLNGSLPLPVTHYQIQAGNPMQRAVSTPPLPTNWEIGSGNNSSNISTASNSPRNSIDGSSMYLENEGSFYRGSANPSTEFLKTKKSDLESLLNLLNETLENNSSDKASDLHMISLLNINKLSLGTDGDSNASAKRHEQILKKNLLDSLAQPFLQNYNPDSTIEEEEEGEGEGEVGNQYEGEDDHKLANQIDQYTNDTYSLSTPKPNLGNTRILHLFTSGKNSSPKAIFTCSQQHPWQFKAANDLACLIFGVSKNALRALTLLDLIHSDSRNFVLSKLMSTEGQELVFTGEIVGIIQPGNTTSGLIWSSIWAKRKKGLIFCVFEKVPCDYMDVLLNLNDFSVDSIVGGEGLQWRKEDNDDTNFEKDESTPKKKSVKFVNEVHDVKTMSKSLSNLIEDVRSGKLASKDDGLLPMPIRVSDHINDTRYFTLNHLSYNIPCAVSSSILENDLKLKIHSLPYQAGIFIVDSRTFNLISFNKSISKNMFGLHAHELMNKSITEIIPSFCEMVRFIKLRYPHLDINLPKNKGLVLTEHFFRKIQADMMNNGEDFYNSIGIDAVHRDGCYIKVDIQLRVMDSFNFLLWITHSRDVFFKSYTTNPSQLQMLKENEIAVVGSGGSSEASSKRPTKKIPVEDFKALKDNLEDLKIDSDDRGASADHGHERVCSSGSVLSKDRNPDKQLDKNTELAVKLEIAKKYNQDKSQFVKEGNFKLDEDLILNLTSSPSSTSQMSLGGSTTAPTTGSDNYYSPTDSQEFYASTPEHTIGALKHIKKFSDFVILQKMGEGAYGKVDLCMHKVEQYIVVIKLIFKERILVDTWVRDRKLGTIPSEIQIMATLNKKPHENILTLLDFFEDDDYYYIETPMHGETGSIDLFDLIELKTNMTEHEAKLIFKQVASGIKHLHDNGIVHRDIKDENIIVDNKGFVKLIDFGSAAYVKSGPFDVFVGTIDYAAPEVLGGDPYEGKPQDIWAIGVLLYTIIFKENPFYNIDEILDGDLRISSSVTVSEECIALIRRILNRSVPKRPTIEEIYNDSWLQL